MCSRYGECCVKRAKFNGPHTRGERGTASPLTNGEAHTAFWL